MLKSKKKVLALTISALILLLSFGTTSYAQTIQSTLKAQFVSFKILMNGTQVTPKDSQGNTVQPLLVNGTTYLPIRAFGDLFAKNVDFDNSLKQISISDKPNNEIESLKAQIREKDNQILLLQAQLAAKSGNRSLSVVEDELNDEYEDYEGLDVDITLSGTKSKITVKVDVGSKSKWNKLSSSKQTKLLQNIVDDLNDEYDDPSISGTVKAGSSTISSFTVNSSGKVKLSSSDFSDIEEDLFDDYKDLGYDYFNNDTIVLDYISLEGDEDDLELVIALDLEEFYDEKYKWSGLSRGKITKLAQDICNDIWDIDEFEDADIEGIIIDTYENEELESFSVRAGKTVSLD